MTQLGAAAIAVLLATSLVGGAIQGVLGFGFAVVLVPVLALVEPDAVPVTVLLMAVPMTAMMALRERHAIDVAGFGTIMVGRMLGIVVGVAVLSIVATETLTALVGVMILVGVALSVVGLDIEPRRWVNVGAGILSGLMGTTSAIGGPALAVVYARRPGPELRSTLALAYLTGLVVSIASLGALGHIERGHLVLAVELLPGLLVGLWLSVPLTPVLDRGWLRPAVLSFAGAAGAAIVLRALV